MSPKRSPSPRLRSVAFEPSQNQRRANTSRDSNTSGPTRRVVDQAHLVRRQRRRRTTGRLAASSAASQAFPRILRGRGAQAPSSPSGSSPAAEAPPPARSRAASKPVRSLVLRDRPQLTRRSRLMQPLLEVDLAESRVADRNQRPLTELRPEVAGVRIGANLARVVVRGEILTDQFIEPELLWTGHFNRAVHRRAHRDLADGLRDVIRGHRLKEDWWHPDRGSGRGVVGNTFDELEELCGVNDRVRDPATFDQHLLRIL